MLTLLFEMKRNTTGKNTYMNATNTTNINKGSHQIRIKGTTYISDFEHYYSRVYQIYLTSNKNSYILLLYLQNIIIYL
jgi:hypothetical protein